MSEANRKLALRWMQEVWNERSDATIVELIEDETIGHLDGVETKGREEWKAARDILLKAFPDLRITVEDTSADGDSVVLRWTVSATHLGEGLGFPPTGRATSFGGITWMRFRHGHIVEGWDAWNPNRMMDRLRASVEAEGRAVKS